MSPGEAWSPAQGNSHGPPSSRNTAPIPAVSPSLTCVLPSVGCPYQHPAAPPCLERHRSALWPSRPLVLCCLSVVWVVKFSVLPTTHGSIFTGSKCSCRKCEFHFHGLSLTTFKICFLTEVELIYNVVFISAAKWFRYIYTHTWWWFSCSVMSDSATPWTIACQGPLSVGFPRQEYWSRLPFPSPGDLPNPGIKPGSPALQADSLLTELHSNHIYIYIYIFFFMFFAIMACHRVFNIVPYTMQ